MTTHAKDELLSRLNLVEQMIDEGRRTTTFYGWMFVLWGLAYFVAVGWSTYLPQPVFAWPVVMTLTAVLGGIIASRKQRGRPLTIRLRAVGAVWIATGSTIFLFAFAAGPSKHGWVHPHAMMAGIELLLGLANMASAITLRWKVQAAAAVLWWGCGVASFYVSGELLTPVLLVGTVFGDLVFGVYLMVLESRLRRSDSGLDLNGGPSQVAHG